MPPLRSYIYYFVEPDGSIPLFNGGEFPGDDEAFAHASVLLDSFPERHSVEVWAGEDRLRTVRRDGGSGAGERALEQDGSVG